MNISDIDRILTGIIAKYQRKIREAYSISGEFALRPDEMDKLVLANARALGARSAQKSIREIVSFSGSEGELSKQVETEALPQIIRAIEGNIDMLLGQKETHLETFRTLYEILQALKLEQLS